MKYQIVYCSHCNNLKIKELHKVGFWFTTATCTVCNTREHSLNYGVLLVTKLLLTIIGVCILLVTGVCGK